MQAIETKYIGATNTKPSRVKATGAAGSITFSWDHSLDGYENHRRVALAIMLKLGWHGHWVAGANAGNGYCFVCYQRHDYTHNYDAAGNVVAKGAVQGFDVWPGMDQAAAIVREG